MVYELIRLTRSIKPFLQLKLRATRLVLGEGLEPPQPFRASRLQRDAIAATRTQLKIILPDIEPMGNLAIPTHALQKHCSTSELHRLTL